MNNFVTVGNLFAPSPMYVTGFAKIVPKSTTTEIHYTLTCEDDTDFPPTPTYVPAPSTHRLYMGVHCVAHQCTLVYTSTHQCT